MVDELQTAGEVMLSSWLAGDSIATLAHDYRLHIGDQENCLRRIIAKREALAALVPELCNTLEDAFAKPHDDICTWKCDKCIPFDPDNDDSCGLYRQCSTLAKARKLLTDMEAPDE